MAEPDRKLRKRRLDREDYSRFLKSLGVLARSIAENARELEPVDRGLAVHRQVDVVCSPIATVSPEIADAVGRFLRDRIARSFMH